jgi:hypothetical protein
MPSNSWPVLLRRAEPLSKKVPFLSSISSMRRPSGVMVISICLASFSRSFWSWMAF